ncbi:MAG: twin-arginine translocation signal domain-containing protein [Chromatiales bacterium]|nr:MAG: twin-arginine translocation signal domain-containing protein [Chromatiales bacterium]
MQGNEKSRTRKARRSRLSLLSRRRFIKTAGAATSAVTIGFGTTAFGAEELPRVNEDDPMAKALNYVHDAKTVDAAKRFSDRYCNNCALYAGAADDAWAKCSIFPGKVVAGEGWCSAWAPKQSG